MEFDFNFGLIWKIDIVGKNMYIALSYTDMVIY